jgi:hypothetical protein
MFPRPLRLLAAPIALILSLALPQFAQAQFTPDIPIGHEAGVTVSNNDGDTVTLDDPGSPVNTAAARTSAPTPFAARGVTLSLWMAAALQLALRRWMR